MLKELQTKKVGLVLSGGGVRGIAHLGVAKALSEYGIKPAMISGVSAGAIAGAFLADGQDPQRTAHIFTEQGIFDYVSFTLSSLGIMKITKLKEALDKYVSAKTFEDLKTPLAVTACNLETGKPEYFTSGELALPIVASSSLPVVFRPVKMNGKLYADGGIMQNLPTTPIAKQCDFLIGVHVNSVELDEITSVRKVAERAFNLAMWANILHDKKKCHVFIEPPGLTHFGVLSLSKTEDLFDCGYNEAVRVLENLKKL